MAKIIPGLNSAATQGERRFAQRLETLLEDDYLCWFNVPVGSRYQHPDFVTLNPRRGILVIEVKDWRLEKIRCFTPHAFELETLGGIKQVPNPLEQCRHYAFAIKELLERDHMLLAPVGHPYQGRLAFPYGFGVALSEVSRKQFDAAELGRVIPEHLVICKDEMTENSDPEAFQKRLWDMFTVRFECLLSTPQVDRIRWHLFPEIRISQGNLFGFQSEDTNSSITAETMMQVMDLQQEQLARSLGDGHRVIHGVVGSGKTLILGYRCQKLAESSTKPILVLCFNVALSASLERMMVQRGVGDKVAVRHFHGWCGDQLKLYHVAKPVYGPDYHNRMVLSVIAAVEKGLIPRAQYGAVLIDEGHDFQPEWFKLITQMLDPESNSLLLLYDDAQALYKERSRKFSFKSVGVQAQGRTTILKINYRNTNEILESALNLAEEYIRPEGAEEDGVPLIKPLTAGRHGAIPRLVRAATLSDEAMQIVSEIKAMHAKGTRWADMAVLYPAHFIGEEITAALQRANVPHERLEKGNSRKYKPGDDSVKVMTMHASKGLEFPVVLIAGLGFMPYRDGQQAADAKLLYVAMTRATETLILTASRSSVFVEKWARWEQVA